MNFFVAVGITIGVLAGIWAQYCGAIGLLSWVGFISWACFYAAGGKVEGIKKGLISNLAGVFWGYAIILIMGLMGNLSVALGIAVAIGAFAMCIQAQISIVSFIPGAFAGCAAFFGAGASKEVIISVAASLICGSILGFISEASANKLTEMFPEKKAN